MAIDGMNLTTARMGIFPCGEVRCGDMVVFADGTLGQVQSIWQSEGIIYIGAALHRKVEGIDVHWELTPYTFDFVDSRLLQEAVPWYSRAECIVVAAPLYS